MGEDNLGALLWLVIGAFIAFSAGRVVVLDQWLDRRGAVTRGRVVDRKSSFGEAGRTHRTRVAYGDGAGTEVSKWFPGHHKNPVKVEYDPDHPTIARIPDKRRSKLGDLLWILGLLLGLSMVIYNGTYLLGWWG